jgi:hypothetical protein
MPLLNHLAAWNRVALLTMWSSGNLLMYMMSIYTEWLKSRFSLLQRVNLKRKGAPAYFWHLEQYLVIFLSNWQWPLPLWTAHSGICRQSTFSSYPYVVDYDHFSDYFGNKGPRAVLVFWLSWIWVILTVCKVLALPLVSFVLNLCICTDTWLQITN